MAYIDDRLRLIETVPDAFVGSIEVLREDLIKALTRQIAQLDSIDGNLVLSEANIRNIDSVISSLDNFLFDSESEYIQALTKFIDGIQESSLLTNQFLGIDSNPVYKAVLDNQKFNTIKLFDKTAIDQAIGNQIRAEISSAIAQQGNVAKTIDSIRTFIGGDAIQQPALTKYAKTQSLTAFASADREYVTAVGKGEGIERWLYSGSLVKDSRPFCTLRVGKVFTTKEIEAWATEEAWAGMIAGTNASNIFSNLGGWNCRHVLTPVR